MILQTPNPPELTGNAAADVALLREWCCALNRQLRYVIAEHDEGIRASQQADTDNISDSYETEASEE
ncbi:MAG: hypothetical protein ACI4DP_13355 [Candidatus Ornithomonoglobus sp.]